MHWTMKDEDRFLRLLERRDQSRAPLLSLAITLMGFTRPDLLVDELIANADTLRAALAPFDARRPATREEKSA